MTLPSGLVPRRAILGALPVMGSARAVLAQDFPARPLRLIVPFGPGGITDLVARVVAERTAAHLGVPVVVENRPGANGNIAGDFVAKSAADGHTLLMASLAMFSVNPAIYSRMPFDPRRDFEAVLPVASTPHVLVCQPSLPARDLKALIAAAQQRPEALSFGTAGAGSSPHQTQLLFENLARAKLLAVHFRGGAASVQAVLAGQVQLTAEATPVVAEHIRAGTLRALAVAAPERIRLLPDVPTANEAGLPGLENGSTSAVVVTRCTPPAAVARLAEAFNAALRAPETQARLAQQGTFPLGGTGADFQSLVEREVPRWRPLLAGISSD